MSHLDLLVTVKTYPHPSRKYLELVCTAGVDKNGDWYRLYPVDYRYQPFDRKYKKYQWISVDVEKSTKDKRKESYKPRMDTLKIVGEVGSERNWEERKKYVLRQVNQCPKQLTNKGESLGIIKPREVVDFVIQPEEEGWKKRWADFISMMKEQTQMDFGTPLKELEKIPYRFIYHFYCGDETCHTLHKMMIHDWEVYQLYRNLVEKGDTPEIALQKVKKKYFEQMCSVKRDTHFIIGTIKRFKNFIILGVFWPLKETQTRLFQ